MPVDLHEIIARRYDDLGPGKVNPFFADERVHTSAAGAEFNAVRVIEGLKALSEEQRARSRDFDKVEMSNGGNVHRLILALVNG